MIYPGIISRLFLSHHSAISIPNYLTHVAYRYWVSEIIIALHSFVIVRLWNINRQQILPGWHWQLFNDDLHLSNSQHQAPSLKIDTRDVSFSLHCYLSVLASSDILGSVSRSSQEFAAADFLFTSFQLYLLGIIIYILVTNLMSRA